MKRILITVPTLLVALTITGCASMVSSSWHLSGRGGAEPAGGSHDSGGASGYDPFAQQTQEDVARETEQFNQQQSQDMANQGNQEAAQAASDTGTAVAAGVAAALNPNPAIKIRDHLKRVLLISVVVTACAMHLPGCASELVGSGGDVPFRRR